MTVVLTGATTYLNSDTLGDFMTSVLVEPLEPAVLPKISVKAQLVAETWTNGKSVVIPVHTVEGAYKSTNTTTNCDVAAVCHCGSHVCKTQEGWKETLKTLKIGRRLKAKRKPPVEAQRTERKPTKTVSAEVFSRKPTDEKKGFSEGSSSIERNSTAPKEKGKPSKRPSFRSSNHSGKGSQREPSLPTGSRKGTPFGEFSSNSVGISGNSVGVSGNLSGFDHIPSWVPEEYKKGRGRKLWWVPDYDQMRGARVSVVWGVEITIKNRLLGEADHEWKWDPDYAAASPWSQRQIMLFCQKAAQAENLDVKFKKCWPESFINFQKNRKRQFPARAIDQDILEFLRSPEGFDFYDDIWIEDGKMKASRVSFWIGMSGTTFGPRSIDMMHHWDEFVWKSNERSKIVAARAWHTSPLWVIAEGEQAIMRSTVISFLISMLCAFIGIAGFTRDLLVSGTAILNIIGIISMHCFFMFVVMGWSLGPIEVLGIIVFIGYAVDYVLHIAHCYSAGIEHGKDFPKKVFEYCKKPVEVEWDEWGNPIEAPAEEPAEPAEEVCVEVEQPNPFDWEEPQKPSFTREERVGYALFRMGGSVIGSGVTTMGSAFFLFFCTIVPFKHFGFVCFFVVFFSMIFALISLPSMLLAFGPQTNKWRLRCWCKKAEWNSEWVADMFAQQANWDGWQGEEGCAQVPGAMGQAGVEMANAGAFGDPQMAIAQFDPQMAGQFSPQMAGQFVDPQMAAGQFVDPQMAAGQFVDPQMAAGQFVDPQMAAGQFVDPQMAAGQFVDPQMAAGQYVDPQMAAGQLVDPQMAAGQVVDPQMAAGQLVDPQMAAGQFVDPSGQVQMMPVDGQQWEGQWEEGQQWDGQWTEGQWTEGQ